MITIGTFQNQWAIPTQKKGHRPFFLILPKIICRGSPPINVSPFLLDLQWGQKGLALIQKAPLITPFTGYPFFFFSVKRKRQREEIQNLYLNLLMSFLIFKAGAYHSCELFRVVASLIPNFCKILPSHHMPNDSLNIYIPHLIPVC